MDNATTTQATESNTTSETATFAIGIDLGTTNCAICGARLTDDSSGSTKPQALPVSQVIRPGEVAPKALLPSFLYLPHESEMGPGAFKLPWNDSPETVVGEWARTKGALTPTRLISSAKSWLCHPTMDRRAAFLPVRAPDDVAKRSPLDASATYLAHLKAAWDASVAKDDPRLKLAHQEVTLTVPASFDAVARNLTVEAAKLAGIDHVTLLEEPQAALYAWVEAMGDGWRHEISAGDVILVCDVGGGTTDFSLIQVGEDAGNLTLHRLAVGDHILLGGDNMDLALALFLKKSLTDRGVTLDRWQLMALTHAVRGAKERMLSDQKLQSLDIAIPSRGSKLMGGAQKVQLTREALTRVLLEGFFPKVTFDAVRESPKRVGLSTLGLPYATDPAVTRHLANFLKRHASTTGTDLPIACPTAVLFNGGVMKSSAMRQRVMDVLTHWMATIQAKPPRELPEAQLDLAVAQGAAVFGRVRQGKGIRIRGGTARAYYVGVETSMPAVPGLPPPIQALCLAPMGMEEGTEATLDQETLGVIVGEPVQFRFFGSTVRRHDETGDVVLDVETLDELPSVEATLTPLEGQKPGDLIPAHLKARVTEIGTLELFCQAAASTHSWRLEFDLRTDGSSTPILDD